MNFFENILKDAEQKNVANIIADVQTWNDVSYKITFWFQQKMSLDVLTENRGIFKGNI